MSVQPDYQQKVVDIQPITQEERRARLKRAYHEDGETAQDRLPDFPKFLGGSVWPEPHRGFASRLLGPFSPSRGIAAIRDGIQRAALRLKAVIYGGQWVLTTTTGLEAQVLQDTARRITEMEQVVLSTEENSIAADVLTQQFIGATKRIQGNVEHVMNEVSREARAMPWDVAE